MRHRANRRNSLRFERLESRQLLSGTPLGAMENDTAEYLLGRVAVTPVFLESDGSEDVSTQDWTENEITQTLNKVRDSVQWWANTLDALNTVHELEFIIDDTYAATPHPSPYEPIARPSSDYTLWVGQFLADVGNAGSISLEQGIRNFNHQQRLKHQTDWSFTMFIVDSTDDLDGQFAAGGPFRTAFAFPGGLFFISPSTRPTSTLTHEAGHIFYAMDEYQGGFSYDEHRGYYNTQNLNAVDGNPDPEFVQAASIMSGGVTLQSAFLSNTSPASTLSHIGWQDSDGDGVFDVLDVPLLLTGSGRFDHLSNTYRFEGQATAQTLANQNSTGLQNDITLNRISRIEYRIDGGDWMTASQPDVQLATLSLSLPVGSANYQSLEIRAVDAATGITSNIFEATSAAPTSHVLSGAAGYVWLDKNNDSLFDGADTVLDGFTVQLVDQSGQPHSITTAVDPDSFEEGTIPDPGGVTLSALGIVFNGNVGSLVSDFASTGTKSFHAFDAQAFKWTESWSSSRDQKLQAAFDVPTNRVSIDVTGLVENSYGRLEAYDRAGNLLTRVTSTAVGVGESTTLEIATDEANIASIIAFGHANTSVSLDHLNYGPFSTAQTDENGVFALTGLPDGQYHLAIESPNPEVYQVQQSPIVVNVVAGQLAASNVRVVQTSSPWQNPSLAGDVDNNGSVEPLDALRVINQLNRGGSRALTAGDITPPYYDVNGDGTISPIDALSVINSLNRSLVGAGEAVSNVATSTNHSEPTDELFANPEQIDSLNPRISSFDIPQFSDSPTSDDSEDTADNSEKTSESSDSWLSPQFISLGNAGSVSN